MKKLIAKRPIQYMGRTYGPGDTLPAHDGRMVAAWVRAGTAAWSDTEAERAAEFAASVRRTNDARACYVLRAMGVTIDDDAGNFVGTAALEAQIMALGRERNQEGTEDRGGQELGTGEKAAHGGHEDPVEPEMVTGHLDAEDLAKMKKADLEKLAADMGVDISKAKNNDERAALIAAVEVQAPAQENGGAQ